MNNTINAVVTFRPLAPYFFGSEVTHGNGAEANYFAKGNPLPQQTTLLGALRHLLYNIYGNVGRGPHSFSPDNFEYNDWGYLLGLSPIFLHDGSGRFFLRQALDRQPDNHVLPLTEVEGGALVFADYTQSWKPAYRWHGFEKKKGAAEAWVSLDGTVINTNDIFHSHTRPGIPKKELYNTKESGPGLHKQMHWWMGKGWAFSVLAEFSEEVELKKLNGQTLPIGGEKTIFHISVEAADQDFNTLFANGRMFYPTGSSSGMKKRLVLVSDAFAEPEIFLHTIGGANESVDFRHIRTHASVKQFGALQALNPGESPTNAALAKSVKFTLFRRGSVFVCAGNPELEEVKKCLDLEIWQKAGFNRYFIFQ